MSDETQLCLACKKRPGRRFVQPYGWTKIYNGETGGVSWKHKGTVTVHEKLGVVSGHVCEACLISAQRKQKRSDWWILFAVVSVVAAGTSIGYAEQLFGIKVPTLVQVTVLLPTVVAVAVLIALTIDGLWSLVRGAVSKPAPMSPTPSAQDMEGSGRHIVWSFHREALNAKYPTSLLAPPEELRPADAPRDVVFRGEASGIEYRFGDFERVTLVRLFGPLNE